MDAFQIIFGRIYTKSNVEYDSRIIELGTIIKHQDQPLIASRLKDDTKDIVWKRCYVA